MAYSDEIKQAVRGPTGGQLGKMLGKLAVKYEFPVIEISAITGATRPTVYKWFRGGNVATFYKNAVEDLITTIRMGAYLHEEKK